MKELHVGQLPSSVCPFVVVSAVIYTCQPDMFVMKSTEHTGLKHYA